MYRPAAILGCWVALIAAVGLFFTGDASGQTDVPAAADENGVGGIVVRHRNRSGLLHLDRRHAEQLRKHTTVIQVPYVLPFLAESRFDGVTLQGVRDLQRDSQFRFGPNDYRPNLFVTYWSFRAMIGFMAIPVLFALAGLWLTRGGRTPISGGSPGSRC